LPVRVWIVLSLIAMPLSAPASVVEAVNEVRQQGCPANPRPSARLRENSRLNEAARRLSSGEALQNATRKAGYRSVNSASVQITNVPEDRDIARIVARQFCAQVTGGDLRDIGTFRRGPDIWLIVAAPFLPPSSADRQRIARRVLELTNRARAEGRRCGSESFPPAPPLAAAPAALERAAREHSDDMADHDYMDHKGLDGSSPAERITRTGYKWKTVGENLASGVMSPEEVVTGWLGSPHHCENLMNARFTQMAVAYSVNPSSRGGIYWTQLFGTPR
jgi:uncharacterized protein YkwD